MVVKYSLVPYDYTLGAKPTGTAFYVAKQGFDLVVEGFGPVSTVTNRVAQICEEQIRLANSLGTKINRLEGELLEPTTPPVKTDSESKA